MIESKLHLWLTRSRATRSLVALTIKEKKRKAPQAQRPIPCIFQANCDNDGHGNATCRAQLAPKQGDDLTPEMGATCPRKLKAKTKTTHSAHHNPLRLKQNLASTCANYIKNHRTKLEAEFNRYDAGFRSRVIWHTQNHFCDLSAHPLRGIEVIQAQL